HTLPPRAGCVECSTDSGLIFAFCSHIVAATSATEMGGCRASAYQTSAQNPGLPERVNSTTRIPPEPRGDRPALQSLLARDGPQTPQQPAGEGLHSTCVEPKPLRRADPNARCRTRLG